ncbi:hypothetical protein B0H14DRAFT_105909 [Mycena olivaceomarginata]|nr:hypothetical protein B0H14DRAFT_105909 [Mycena olivaceomarginata]
MALYGPSRSAAPFVLPLLRILARISAQEAMIITEAPFVRPRTKTPDSDDFDGVATMLACHILEGDVPLPSSEDSTTLASETAYPGASSDAESDPSPSFNGPLGAHILPGRGVHACAALPFLCVADQDNIADLMASVACQRHVWGDPDPAVGFVLSGAVMTLVLSWLDPATSTVHIASSASNGVFNLTDTTSALLSLPTASPSTEMPPRNRKKNKTSDQSDQSENTEAKSEAQSETPKHQASIQLRLCGANHP